MKKIIIYSYSKCSTCKKAINWLNQSGNKFDVVDIVNTPPSKELIMKALQCFPEDKKKVFNTRGKSYRELNFKDLNKLSDEELVELLSKDGKLIKRPFLIFNFNKFLIGFNEEEYQLNLNQ